MATLAVQDGRIVVRLSGLERLGGLVRDDPSAPLASVRDIRTTDDPWSELRGIRAPGTGIPRVIALGHRRGRGIHDFAAVYRSQPAVVVDLDGPAWTRFVVSTTDPAALVAELQRAG